MSQETLEQLTDEIQRTGQVANLNLEEIPATVQSAWSTRITEAKEKLVEYKRRYKAAILGNGVAIFLDGDPAKAREFATLVRSESEGLTVDARGLYSRLAEGVEQTIASSRQWGVAQTHKLHLLLQEVMNELGVKEISMPSRNEAPVMPTQEDVTDHIRKILRESNGDGLNRLYIEERAAKEALEIRYMGLLAPVLILNAQAEEKAALGTGFMKGSATVTLNSEDNIDKEFLTKTFKNVNKSIRKK